MTKKIVFFLAAIVMISGIAPVFAEVVEFHLDNTVYIKGDSINAKGVVSSESSGMVTIVFRDSNDKFVLLNQAFIRDDNSFETNIPINQKFQLFGSHNATAFVLNMTAGKTKSFDLIAEIANNNLNSNNDPSIDYSEIESILKEELELFELEYEKEQNILETQIEELNNFNTQEKLIGASSSIADFVDGNKDPRYYLDRYYNEPSYKLWFDRNYPNRTIEQAVGFTDMTNSPIEPSYENVGNEFFPKAEATSYVFSTANFNKNNDIAQIGFVFGGLTVLFGFVFLIKRKIDGNGMKFSLKQKIIKQKIGSAFFYSNNLKIIQTRLAKGEISIEEYEHLKHKLSVKS